MALSILLTRYGGEIDGAEAVAKSLPDFFERLQALGIGMTV
jgi:3-phosphoshikimate 1-carboxyvinyltransferase